MRGGCQELTGVWVWGGGRDAAAGWMVIWEGLSQEAGKPGQQGPRGAVWDGEGLSGCAGTRRAVHVCAHVCACVGGEVTLSSSLVPQSLHNGRGVTWGSFGIG